jgi:hypothetical protein
MQGLFRRFVIPIIALLIFHLGRPAVVKAQDVGLGLFAMPSPKFPCDQALAPFSHSSRPTLALLWGTFGKDTTCLEKWFKTTGEKPHFLEIHLSNEACRRNKRCSSTDFLPELSVAQLNRRLESKDPLILAKYAELISEIRSSVDRYKKPGGEYVLSTGLEDNFSTRAYETVLQAVRAHWPYKVTRSPVGAPTKARILSADYMEGHGTAPSFREGERCIANLDGDDIVFPHRKAGTSRTISWDNVSRFVATYSTRCRATFLWAGNWQGLTSDTFVPPQDRDLIVSREDMDALQPFLK